MSDEKPQPEEAPNRAVACARMALHGVTQELEKENFLGGATSIIRDEKGEIEAVASCATGWRAKWLWNVMELLNDAVGKAVGDLRRGDKQMMQNAIDRAVRDAGQPKFLSKDEMAEMDCPLPPEEGYDEEGATGEDPTADVVGDEGSTPSASTTEEDDDD